MMDEILALILSRIILVLVPAILLISFLYSKTNRARNAGWSTGRLFQRFLVLGLAIAAVIVCGTVLIFAMI